MKRCKICGYVTYNEDDDFCLKCGAKKEMLIDLAEEEIAKLERADATNDCLVRLMQLADQMLETAAEGAEEKLDPACERVFAITIAQALSIKELARAEIASHVKKDKF
ncbi:MAG: rubredoxin [Erysipelotrichaceae bacterium]|nr:rubredoxin [Erysipelotrichaceae bacterium]